MSGIEARMEFAAAHRGPRPTQREVRLRDMLASIEEWWRASGEDRDYWRWRSQCAIADFRKYHLVPEEKAFRAAVAHTLAVPRAA